MKRLLFFILMMVNVPVFSNTTTDSTKILLNQARVATNTKSRKYDPHKAFGIYSKLAQRGNPEAMNGMGVLFAKGIGVTENDSEALKWFIKSAGAGYAHSYFNLGAMYKGGIGTTQDFVRGFRYYKQGADLNDGMCLYEEGYMYYKGFGCNQDYQKAVVLFKRGAAVHNEAAYYMLGLCYRNGYGITTNPDSAVYWLSLSAKHGDQRAAGELSINTPENTDVQNVVNLQAPAKTGSEPVNLKSGFRQISHHIIRSDLAGNYIGYIIKFDWSGKHVIGQKTLKLNLENSTNSVSGEWEEGDSDPIAISGTLADTALVFNNSNFSMPDHYHTPPQALTFKNSHLNMVKVMDTVYLSGTISLYSLQTREPEKPEFIMLIRTGATNKSDSSFFAHNTTKVDSLHFLAYPNPFTSIVQLRYTLKKSGRVSILVSNVLNGAIVYRSAPELVAAGDHTSPVSFAGEPGNYVVTLQYGNQVKSKIVFKQ